MKTINVRSKNTFAISETSSGQTTAIRSVDGDIQNVIVSGSTGVVTVTKGTAKKNYVYDLERALVIKCYSVG